ncbi:TetR/AcrR family transcriptional regulator [Bradyrhizobium sp. SSUT112]|uniref:TetR/AcrR family transcriptional regulator n=1 Tax=Bradyrhizobium sp. SSUT112 TaxID=3040604 RepID=UPI0024490554|nr:TetR/AcrR family transcriptional regulator [Bradyrhizobium sp. SSUT112]MDH2352237.1 TetR/AcrR family transcriptional regulator [Bradyrhizobium sp. SSUT112]
MDELSQGAGINRPSLRLAFGDRESIICAAVERHGCEIRAALQELCKASLEDSIKAMLRRLVMIYSPEPPAERGCVLLTLMPSRDRQPAVSAAIANVRMEISRAVARRIRAATPEAAAATLTQVCLGMIFWLSVEARAGASRETLNRAADAFAQFIDQCSGAGKYSTSCPVETGGHA